MDIRNASLLYRLGWLTLVLLVSGCGGAEDQADLEMRTGEPTTQSEVPTDTERHAETVTPHEPAPTPDEVPSPPSTDPYDDAVGGETTVTPPAAEPVAEAFLPPWWHDEPVARAGRLYACAAAEAASLSAANRAAVATGLNALRAALLERSAGNVESLLADSRTEAAAADRAGPDLWRGFVEVSVEYAGDR
jgi:hypothetical protein